MVRRYAVDLLSLRFARQSGVQGISSDVERLGRGDEADKGAAVGQTVPAAHAYQRVATAGHLRAQRWVADSARRRPIRRFRATPIQARIRFLHESLPPGTCFAGVDVAGIE